MISVLDVFRIGIGPSSSHTVGPMRIAHRFISELSPLSQTSIEAISVELIGSLAYTGEGHGTPDAVLMGLLGYEPETIDVSEAQAAIRSMKENQRLRLPNGKEVQFNPDTDVRLVF
ncbi:MAG: serine dehydratase beta chain, partial [Pseudomonadota bacterium]